jgi:hypothetical protein
MAYSALMCTELDSLEVRFDLILNILPNPIYVFHITYILKCCWFVWDLNLILFLNLQLIKLPEIKSFNFKFLCCLFITANPSLNFATTRYWSVSQTDPLKYRTASILDYHLLSINSWSIWLWIFPSGEVQIYIRSRWIIEPNRCKNN